MKVLQDLLALLPAPASPLEAPTQGDWVSLQGRFSLSFPEDYRVFLTAYGTGTVDDFLWVLSPFAQNRNLNIIEQADRQLDGEREFARLAGIATPYALAPDPEGLYPWAITDNGDILHWLRQGSPSEWTVVVRHNRANGWEEFSLTTTGFLLNWLRQDIVVRAFPDDVPSDMPNFIPADAGQFS